MAEHHDARGGDGRFTRTPDTAERDAEACKLRTAGLTYREIAKSMGWESSASAYDAVQRALKAIVQEPAEAVRQLELERLDALYAKATQVLDREHVVVSANGKIVYEIVEYARDGDGNIQIDDDGRPLAKEIARLRDDGPTLAAVKTLLAVMERRAKLIGLDSPTKVDVGGQLKYEIVGVDLGTPK